MKPMFFSGGDRALEVHEMLKCRRTPEGEDELAAHYQLRLCQICHVLDLIGFAGPFELRRQRSWS